MRLSAAGEALLGPARQILRAIDEARSAISGVVELRTGTIEIAALATLAVDPMATLIGRFRERHPGIQITVLEPESADGVRALVRDGACELGAAHLPLPGDQLTAHPLGEQELLFVLPPDPAPHSERPLGARELAQTPLVVSPPGTSTRMLLEQALAAVGVTPQIAVQTAAREAIVPLVLAGAGAALLPAPLAHEANRAARSSAALDPPITRTVGLIHRQGPLSAAASAFLELASDRRVNFPNRRRERIGALSGAGAQIARGRIRGAGDRRIPERHPVTHPSAVVQDRSRWISGVEQPPDRVGSSRALSAVAEEHGRHAGVELAAALEDLLVRDRACA